MITNATATLYISMADGFDRLFLPAVMWQGAETQTRSVTGADGGNSTSVYIPLAQVDDIPKGSYIVRGDCDYIYSCEHKISELTRGYAALTITKVTKCDYGSTDMQHWELTAV